MINPFNLSDKNAMNTSHALCTSALAMTLVACGGSPASDPVPTPTPTPTLSVSSLQGIWRSPAGAANTLSAVALPDGKVWASVSNASNMRVIKGSFAVQGNAYLASGKSFTLGASTSTSTSLTATVLEKTSLSGVISTGSLSENYSLAYQTRYDTAAALADFAGAWSASLGPGTVNWTVATSGAITGTRTTGCTYAGQLSLRAEQKAVVDAVVTETCAGAVTQLSGVAVKSEDKTGISMLLTNTDDSAAVAVNLANSQLAQIAL
jgi:hypothetical protein